MRGDSTIPLIVIGGSLGAGKTTLLRELVEDQGNVRCHVIVNEIGEVPPGLGDFNVRSESATVLRGGCACCIRREDLIEELISFANDTSRCGEDLIFLELSGVADPAPVIHTILGHPFLANHYYVQEVIIVIDAYDSTGSRRDSLWMRQVALADRCILAKADLVSSDELDELSNVIGQINPWAVRAESEHGNLRTERIRTQGIGRRPLSDPMQLGMEATHGTLPNVTFINAGSEFDWGGFGVWLSLLLHRWGHEVLRVKGLVPAGPGKFVTVQAVHHVVFPPEHVTSHEVGDGQIAFITRNIDPNLITRSLEEFLEVSR